ncbi:MAG: PTS sugar transporter subunit IIA [Enterocloster asparagiformis]|nr:PTS sugar transporter subunit IIA [Enterocloster asparagiformis]
MVKYFLSSHGHLASGLKSSIDVLLGGCSRLTVFDAYVDERSLEEVLNGFYTEVNPDDQVILLSDMYGGSVNSIMYTFLDRPNTTLIAGVNLALVIGLVINDRELTRAEIEDVVRQSREALRIVDLDETSQNGGDEELF